MQIQINLRRIALPYSSPTVKPTELPLNYLHCFRLRPVLYLKISGEQQKKHLVCRVLGGRLQVQTDPAWSQV